MKLLYFGTALTHALRPATSKDGKKSLSNNTILYLNFWRYRKSLRQSNLVLKRGDIPITQHFLIAFGISLDHKRQLRRPPPHNGTLRSNVLNVKYSYPKLDIQLSLQ